MVLGAPILITFIRLYCAQILGHLKIINFPVETNGNFFLGVPIFQHFTVSPN